MSWVKSMGSFARRSLLAVTLLPAPGCKGADQNPTGPSAEPSAGALHDELTSRYSAMTAAERIQAAMKVCYVGRDCDGSEAKALLEAAATPSEREALKATARSTFLRQYAAFLRDQGKKLDSVSSKGDADRTIRLDGDACSRFLLENFGSGAPGKTAKLIGFTRFECESKALRAGIDL
jgi:hypothetical protein